MKCDWEQMIGDLKVWERAGQRAPHKPLLTLLLLARAQRNDSNTVPFAEIEEPLRKLLVEFGPPRKSHHPEYPFWYLKNDGFWTIENEDDLSRRKGKDQPTRTQLLKANACGSVPEDLWKALRDTPSTIPRLAQSVLSEYWPETLHDSILNSVGLAIEKVAVRKKRDPEFRPAVLRAYEGRCAVCGYDGRLEDALFGLDAAHVRWHAYGGPDRADNGLALCSLHHVALDKGAISLDDSNKILVSQDLRGDKVVRSYLVDFQGKQIRPPQAPEATLNTRNVRWHRTNVFRKPARTG